jgi:DNA-binding transcriptional LysR family regulator
VLSRYRSAHPGVELHGTEAGSRTLLTRLGQGELDLALVTAEHPGENPAVDLIPLLREELVVVSAAHLPPLTKRRAITLAELAGQQLVACHDGYDLRVLLDRAFAAAGLQPNTVVEGAELDAVLRFVARGIGVTVAPTMAALNYPGLRAVRLTSPALHRTIGLAHRTDLAPSHAATAFRALLDEAIAEIGTDTTAGLSIPVVQSARFPQPARSAHG